MVLISALGKNAIWFCKWISSGVSSSCFAIATPILCRISDAAAFVNVTMSSLSISCSSRKSFVIMRSTRTAVLPLPAAAAISKSLPLASIACFCSFVHLFAIAVPPHTAPSAYCARFKRM